MDATYRSDLKALNEQSPARFEAQLEASFARIDAALERGFALQKLYFFLCWATVMAAIIATR